jgi:hypothetical protein
LLTTSLAGSAQLLSLAQVFIASYWEAILFLSGFRREMFPSAEHYWRTAFKRLAVTSLIQLHETISLADSNVLKCGINIVSLEVILSS